MSVRQLFHAPPEIDYNLQHDALIIHADQAAVREDNSTLNDTGSALVHCLTFTT